MPKSFIRRRPLLFRALAYTACAALVLAMMLSPSLMNGAQAVAAASKWSKSAGLPIALLTIAAAALLFIAAAKLLRRALRATNRDPTRNSDRAHR